ncbi:hypothetical protein ACIQHY_12270 [Streptomyces sp. NPDC092359]
MPEQTETSVPATDFAAEVNTHDVTAITLGRQPNNDADKDMYFE